MTKIAVSAGEISGEMHLSRIIDSIQSLKPEISFFGMGSAILAKQGVKIILDSKKWGNLNGFNIPVILAKSIYALVVFIWKLVKERPDALILVDYPDFNLRLAFFAKLLKIPVIYYIPPKLWAWRTSRIHKIKKYVDHVIAIFPFEVEFYKNLGFENISYFGHPFSETLKIKDKTEAKKLLNLGDIPAVAIFPGSRKSEVQFLIDIIINSTKKLEGLQFILSVARHFEIEDFAVPANIKLIKDQPIEVMQACDYGILKCGTCNLEAAYLNLPHVVIYKVSKIAYAIIMKYVKIKSYSLVNIIKPGTTKEIIQENCTEENIITELNKIINDLNYRNSQLESFEKIRDILGYQSNISKKIAEKIIEVAL